MRYVLVNVRLSHASMQVQVVLRPKGPSMLLFSVSFCCVLLDVSSEFAIDHDGEMKYHSTRKCAVVSVEAHFSRRVETAPNSATHRVSPHKPANGHVSLREDVAKINHYAYCGGCEGIFRRGMKV